MRTRTHGNKLLTPALLTAYLLTCALSTYAQSATGTVKGKITGPDGNAVAGAQVTLVVQETGLNPRSVTSSAQGDYTIADLSPGVYKITVEAAGFKTVIAEDVDVLAGDTQELRFTLEPGDPQDTVNIAPEVPPTPPPAPPADRRK